VSFCEKNIDIKQASLEKKCANWVKLQNILQKIYPKPFQEKNQEAEITETSPFH
jgi:hypothetical protein